MLGIIVRFISSAIVLMVVGWFLPGFSVSGFTGALVAAGVIALLGYIVESLLGKAVSPRSRGFVGFITAAAVIYLAQFLIPNMLRVSFIGALLSALVIGLIDLIVPTAVR